MDFLAQLPWGAIITILVALTGAWSTYIAFRVSAGKDLIAVNLAIADTNRRVTDLSAGFVTVSAELREFKNHIEKHYVEKDEISALR